VRLWESPQAPGDCARGLGLFKEVLRLAVASVSGDRVLFCSLDLIEELVHA
jgi:hypothetical protein